MCLGTFGTSFVVIALLGPKLWAVKFWKIGNGCQWSFRWPYKKVLKTIEININELFTIIELRSKSEKLWPKNSNSFFFMAAGKFPEFFEFVFNTHSLYT